MNANQMKILELWKHLSEKEKREIAHHFNLDELLFEHAQKYKGESTMNFGQATRCPTCGK